MSKTTRWLPLLALLPGLWAAPVPALAGDTPAPAPIELHGFDFHEGDMVALLGGTFFERDEQGYLETALTQAFASKRLRFRNLAWSADTVWGHSRSYFGPPAEGLQRLKGHLEQIKPQVVICHYGAAEAWEGPEKIPAFLDGYRKLLDLIQKAAGSPRVILVSPLPGENRPPRPNLDAYNAHVAAYRDAVRQLAAERHAAFIDAGALLKQIPNAVRPLTWNGLHLTETSYRTLAVLLPTLLGLPGRPLDEGLRSLVAEKNRLFFNRWRPANETYLFGFRKHEQGQNAAEIPLFDPLIEAKEKEIAAYLDKREP